MTTNGMLVPIGLVVSIIVGALAVGASFNQIEANAEDIDTLEEDIDALKTIRTRSIMTNENINVLLERQQRLLESQDEQLDVQQRQIDRINILIERLAEEGGSMSGR